MSEKQYDLTIIGGGPAGLTAGLYAARSQLDVVLLEKGSLGGQVLTTEWVENYPGFPEGIGGTELMERMRDQAVRFGLQIQQANVTNVDLGGPVKKVDLADGPPVTSRALILASGAHPRKLGADGEAEFTGKGVSYCATCDGAFFTDAVIAVVGGGDMAVEEAVYLTKFGSKVYIIHRRDELRATKVLQERALDHPKIEMVWDSVVDSITGDDLVKEINLTNVKTGEKSALQAEACFIFVGTLPLTGFVDGVLELNEQGFIVTDREMATNIPGVFAAGDCTNKTLRQISTAVGEGAAAAFSAEKYLESPH